MINEVRWRKSTRSGATDNGCVELAHTLNLLRDGKNPSGPTLAVDVPALLTAVKDSNLR